VCICCQLVDLSSRHVYPAVMRRSRSRHRPCRPLRALGSGRLVRWILRRRLFPSILVVSLEELSVLLLQLLPRCRRKMRRRNRKELSWLVGLVGNVSNANRYLQSDLGTSKRCTGGRASPASPYTPPCSCCSRCTSRSGAAPARARTHVVNKKKCARAAVHLDDRDDSAETVPCSRNAA
jgi:hypothetical protein